MSVAEPTEIQVEYLDGLRELLARLEECPDLIDIETASIQLNLFAENRERAVELSRLLGGTREKYGLGDYYFVVRRAFGPHSIEVNVAREKVCKRVVVGTREVPAKPAGTEEVVEWVCEDSLFAETR